MAAEVRLSARPRFFTVLLLCPPSMRAILNIIYITSVLQSNFQVDEFHYFSELDLPKYFLMCSSNAAYGNMERGVCRNKNVTVDK